MSRHLQRRKAGTAILLGALVAAMVGLAFAAVPLYRLFCQATGFEGTTQRAAGSSRRMVRRASIPPARPWSAKRSTT